MTYRLLRLHSLSRAQTDCSSGDAARFSSRPLPTPRSTISPTLRLHQGFRGRLLDPRPPNDGYQQAAADERAPRAQV